MHWNHRRGAALGAVAALIVAGSAGARLSQPVASTNAAATAAGGNVDWSIAGGDSDNSHYSPLAQINTSNVSKLGIAWTQQEGPNLSVFENYPVVVHGVMYYTTNTDQVRAVNAATGKLLWQYTPKVNFYISLAGGGGGVNVNRGVTVHQGTVYLTTFDAHLIALQASTGEELWNTPIAPASAGYSESSYPTYWDGMLFVGGALGDSGLRGQESAFDARTGKKLWTFYTIPAPGHGWVPATGSHGGGDVWMPATIDPGTGILYFGTGNPSPDFNNAVRPGCNRWVNATVALDARTGKFLWGHTEYCNDVWDYDSMPQPFLMTLTSNGKTTRVLAHANKSGVLWFFEPKTGKVLAHTPHLSTWSVPHLKPNAAGVKVCPGANGGVEYGPASFSPQTQAVYQDYNDICMIFKTAPRAVVQGHQLGQIDTGGSIVPAGKASGGIDAIDPHTGKILWHDVLGAPTSGGTLATAGGLVFTGSDTQHFYAIDARTGKILWSPDLGLGFGAAPMAYEVNGTEYIAVAVGGTGGVSETGVPYGGTMVVFKLGGKPVHKLPVVTPATGIAKLPPLSGYTRVNRFEWVNAAKKLVVFHVVAAQTSANNGFNFDGWYNGQATFTVPQYWGMVIEFTNKAALPHSAAITYGHVAPAKVWSSALGPIETADPIKGNTGNTWQIIGGGLTVAADTAGHFYLSCLVPGHLQSGMWDNFVVSPTANAPSITAPGL
jgi:PQQ-dependent dehydrogenase (methanol/ethanol family)